MSYVVKVINAVCTLEVKIKPLGCCHMSRAEKCTLSNLLTSFDEWQ